MKNLTVLPTLAAAAAVIAGPVLAQPPVVDFSAKGDFVYLDYNPPGGKAPAVKLACTKGVGRVDVAQYEAQPNDQTVTLSSGGQTAALGGKKSTGARGDFVKAQIFASDKVMVNFRGSGDLDISGQGFQDKISAGAGKAAVEQFFAGCEEGR